MTTPSVRFLSSTNGFIPKATGQAISYIKKESKWPLKDYCQFIESPATQGVYAIIDRDSPVRVVTDSEFAFEDGAESPTTNYNGLAFAWVPFVVWRRAYASMLGWQAIDMAKDSWKPLQHLTGSLLSVAYTNRTNRVVTLLQNPANWGQNTADVNTLNNGAGTWDQASDDPASVHYNAIKKAILESVRQITLQTNGIVGMEDLRLLLSPGLAQAMANTAEIHNYLKNNSAASLPNLEGEKRFREKWGLPSMIAGLPIIIEDSVIVGDRPASGVGAGTNVSSNRTFIKSDTSAVILSRQGGIDGDYGSPSFSTLQLYWYEFAAAVYAFSEMENFRERVMVVDQFQEILAAPESGFLLTNTLS